MSGKPSLPPFLKRSELRGREKMSKEGEKELLIRVENFGFKYPGTRDWVLQDINLDVHRGDFVSILGESGCGKSTLCRALVGLIPHSLKYCELKGKIHVCDMLTEETPITTISKKVGMVFQDPEAQFMSLKVEDEIVFGLENRGLPEEEITRILNEVSETVGIGGILEKSPFEISGGEKQRVVIGSVLALKPEIIILDEPTSELDPIGRKEILASIGKINQELGITIIYVTHETEEAAYLSNKVALMDQGRFIRQGHPLEVFPDQELFKNIGIRLPQVTELYLELQKRGLQLNDIPYLTLEEAEEDLADIIDSKLREVNSNEQLY